MRASLYSNPMFATGLSDMLGSFLGGGDPYKIATAELAAAKAGNENDTRLYRQQMGEAGNGGDLAQMLVSALQAGSDFSSQAPEITASLASLPGSGIDGRDWAKVLVGTGVENMPGDTLSDMLAGYMIQPSGGGGGGGGGGGRSGGGGAAASTDPRALSRGGTSALLSDLGEKGLTPDEAYGVVAQAEALLTANPGMTENEALSRIMQGTSIEEKVIDPNDSWLNPMDWFTGPETERQVVTPEISGPAAPAAPAAAPAADVGQPDAAAALDQARAAIAAGADRVAVMMRLREMGIDPAGL